MFVVIVHTYTTEGCVDSEKKNSYFEQLKYAPVQIWFSVCKNAKLNKTFQVRTSKGSPAWQILWRPYQKKNNVKTLFFTTTNFASDNSKQQELWSEAQNLTTYRMG